MELQDYFPIWKKLTISQQRRLTDGTAGRSVKKGTVLHSGDADCTGLLLVRRGQLRAYILSDEGGRSPYTGCSSATSACFRRHASFGPYSLK